MARQMKDSCVEWIGNIPADWNIVRIGTQYTERKTKVSDRDYPPLSVTMKGIVPQLATAAKTDAHDDRKLVCKGDFAINSRSDRRGSCGISAYEGSVSLINTILCPRDEMNPEYYDWLFHSSMFSDEFYKWGHGIVDDLWTTNWQDMKKITIPEPTIDEQIKIADYLAKVCAEIDTVITKTKETIDEYRRYRQSIIANAVTKGIRSNRVMKDSGIKWVKTIPDDWESIAPKVLFSLRKDKAQVGEKQLTASQQYGVIYQDEYMELTGTRIVTVEKDFDILKHVEAGDFVISMRSFQGGLEYSEKSGSISSAYVMLIPDLNLVYPRFYKWLFKSSVYINALQSTSNLVRDGQAMRYSNFAQVRLYTVPLDEQKEIAAYLDKKCAEIDTLIEKKTALLAEMETYKKSIIYEYVTGKKECMSSVAQETVVAIYPYFPATLNTDKPRFAQAILMSRILDKCRIKMGRVKLEKMLYTIENSIGFDFDTQYVREAAGPLDSSIYECERIISRRNKWFVLNSSKYGVSYIPEKQSSNYIKYYDKYFKEYDAEIDRIINIFMNYDADQSEIIATLFAAWNDAIIDRKDFSAEEIVDDVLNNWNDSKKRFSKDVWLRAIEEMRKNNLIPNGYGKHTVVKN